MGCMALLGAVHPAPQRPVTEQQPVESAPAEPSAPYLGDLMTPISIGALCLYTMNPYMVYEADTLLGFISSLR